MPIFVCVAAALPFVAMAGCSSSNVKTCGVLPDADACPIGRGGTCQDETCAALYDCLNGRWVLEKTCELSEGGAGGTSSSGGGGAGGESCNGIVVDRTGQMKGCAPPLQEPDCPAAAAELCLPCETGCVDFFICRKDGWESVAFCDPEGNVVAEP